MYPLLFGLFVGIIVGLPVTGFMWVMLHRKTNLREGIISGLTAASGLTVALSIISFMDGGYRGYEDVLVQMLIVVTGYFMGNRYGEVADKRKRNAKKAYDERGPLLAFSFYGYVHNIYR